MVIRISESGKLMLVESGIQEFFHGIRNLGIYYLESGIPNVDSRIQDCLVLYFCFISLIQHIFAASGNYKIQGSNAGQAFFKIR